MKTCYFNGSKNLLMKYTCTVQGLHRAADYFWSVITVYSLISEGKSANTGQFVLLFMDFMDSNGRCSQFNSDLR